MIEVNGFKVKIWDDTSGDVWEDEVDAFTNAQAIGYAIEIAGWVGRDVKEAEVDGESWMRIRECWISCFVASYI